MLDQVYCISLQDSERWHAVEHEVAKSGLELKFQRFLAVDTRDEKWRSFADELEPLARTELEQSLARGSRERNAQLTPGAVGCYLSHVGVYHRALERGERCILVLEDDAQLTPHFRASLRTQLAAIKDWDIFVLGYEAKRRDGSRLRHFYGAYAYVINAQGMRKILDRAWPIAQQYDSALSKWSDTLRIHGAQPQLATHVWQSTTVQTLPMRAPLARASGSFIQWRRSKQ